MLDETRNPPLGWHITMRLWRDQPLTRSAADCRRLSHSIWQRAGAASVLAFRAVDTHVHLLVVGPRRDAGRLAHDAETSMRWQLRLPPAFERARFTAVDDIWHLRNTFEYVLKNAERHGVDTDRLHEGSNLPDLLGMRIAGRPSIAAVRRMLPRVGRPELRDLLRAGLPDVPDRALDPETPDARAGLPHLREAAASAACLPHLNGRSLATRAARVAAVAVASTWLRTADVAELLDLHPATVRRLRRLDPSPPLVQALLRQLQLRAFLPPVT